MFSPCQNDRTATTALGRRRTLGRWLWRTVAGYLRPNRPIERAREQQREVRRLTERWLINADARKEALHGGVVGAEEEDIGKLGVAWGKKMRGLEAART